MSKLFAKHRAKLRSEKNRSSKLNSEDHKIEERIEKQRSGAGIELDITGLSHDGRGIARHKGKMQFVENALPGERVTVELIRHKSKFDDVRAVSVLKANDDRVDPKCRYFERCGGCSLQHYKAGAQIEHKQSVLQDLFRKQGIQTKELLSPIFSDSYHYRSRTRIACDMRKGKNAFGFRERDSQKILEVDECVALSKAISSISSFKEFVSELSNATSVGHVELLDHNGRAVVLLRLVKDLSLQDLTLLERLASEKSADLFIQNKEDGFAKKIWPKEGDALLDYCLDIGSTAPKNISHRIQLNYHPSDFTQVNRNVNQLMVNKVIELLQLSPDQSVLDLFCGLGNFTLPIAVNGAHVTGVEGSEAMVERAKENARLNGIVNADFYAANLFDVIEHQPWAQKQYDSLVLDPPRAGAKELAKDISRFNAKRVVYISCNPATLARDSIEICKQGYRVTKAGILDMFPQTSHLESLAVFER